MQQFLECPPALVAQIAQIAEHPLLDPNHRFLAALVHGASRLAQMEKDHTPVRHIPFTHHPFLAIQCFDYLAGDLWRNGQIPGKLRIGQSLTRVESTQRSELRRSQPIWCEGCRQAPGDDAVKLTYEVREVYSLGACVDLRVALLQRTVWDCGHHFGNWLGPVRQEAVHQSCGAMKFDGRSTGLMLSRAATSRAATC
ncbi:hypothetical protein [Paraburkholderia sediminicola]|uniref:hypothetical protein n=1 Tax=Paraburkholderia sediminicola TaxID=458836 RepID=UPI0038B94289